MAQRLDIYIDTDHDDPVEARAYVEEALAKLKPANAPTKSKRVLFAEVREVVPVAGYDAPSDDK